MVFPGFNTSKKRSTISRGDFDRDGVSNRKDCEPLNHNRQEGGAEFLDADSWNRWKKTQLKFSGNKEKLNEFVQEGKDEFKASERDRLDSHDWYN